MFLQNLNTVPDEMPTKSATCLIVNRPSLVMKSVMFASISSSKAVRGAPGRC